MSSTSEGSKEATKQFNGPVTADIPQADVDQPTEPKIAAPEDDYNTIDDVNQVADPGNAHSINLSSPPDSMSTVSDMGEGPENEIVVGSAKNKSDVAAAAAAAAGNAPAVASEDGGPGGAEAMDIDDRRTEGDKEPEQRPKRKRASLYNDLAEEKTDKAILDDTADDLGASVSSTLQSKNATPNQLSSSAKSVILGYWRNSEAPEPDKHVVEGFIDSCSRLRTRIRPYNRDGKIITDSYPLKSGSRGSWVTFHNVVFDDYLVNLDQQQVKEYVKIRTKLMARDTADGSKNDNTLAVKQAIRTCQARGPPPKGAPPPLIAYGATIPDAARISYSQAEKRRRTASANAAASASTPEVLARRNSPAITPVPSSRQSSQMPVFCTSQRPLAPADPHHERGPRLERAQNLALNAVSRIEANQAKVEQRDAYAASHNGHAGGDSFRENIDRLNNDWSAQETHRIRTGNENAKIHMGVKYERKTNGPFAGKLVSQGAIISIDGEDYVEYRVLTKPTFI
ncbi:hypothetical protein M406DRAFT_326823 [Cryphonectria parasitica EP155]|uniref:Uncharacterized protein n=1 Tax=Cryphonectria parasitica (strain ATCC 38755 / EP155) TaxID=660469 RepID=A0A9P5CRG7_CRYP1|nr:uncharacterized protein M406DRAFT_326823 [Cryphonectria parasitica EP155]KAF3768228.1 hypothetical protein M406DRAFT_326823 [Cryphonectria parasitica EP155]